MMSVENFIKSLRYSLRFLPDEMYLKLYYRYKFKKPLNLKRPKTLNEKLQWLKFNDRNPFYTIVVDKYRNRDYISKLIGKEYIIPLIGVWDNFDEIDFDKLPDKFILKCNHDSGSWVMCSDKSRFDREAAKKKLSKALKRNFYYISREWQYKNIRPKIICEELIGDGVNPPDDYKFLCFNGSPKVVAVCTERASGNTKFYHFNTKDWTYSWIRKSDKNLPRDFTLPKPDNFDKMMELARKLSEPYYFARIDLYDVNGRTYFGEVTLTPDSGFNSNFTSDGDRRLGDMLKIPGLD